MHARPPCAGGFFFEKVEKIALTDLRPVFPWDKIQTFRNGRIDRALHEEFFRTLLVTGASAFN